MRQGTPTPLERVGGHWGSFRSGALDGANLGETGLLVSISNLLSAVPEVLALISSFPVRPLPPLPAHQLPQLFLPKGNIQNIEFHEDLVQARHLQAGRHCKRF